MNDLAQIIVAVATLISSIGAVLIGWRNSQKIETVRVATDGLVTKLVDKTAEASKAVGNLEGRAELKVEQKSS